MKTRSYELPPAELLQALGTLIVAISELEEALHFAIAKSFGDHADRAYTLTAGTMFRPLVAKFGALYHDLPLRDTSSGDITSFCTHLESLNNQRNQLIHAIWLTLDGGVVHRGARRATPKQGLHSTSEEVTAKDVLDLADQFDAAEYKVLEIVSAAEPPPTHSGLT